MPVGYIPGKTIRGDFDLLGHSVSREGVVYAQLAYNRCIFSVPGPDVGGMLMTATARGSHRLVAIRRKGDGVAGGKAAKLVIFDMLGGESDGREGGNMGIEGERECASAMKGRGRTRCRRRGAADRIQFDLGWEGRVRGTKGEVRC